MDSLESVLFGIMYGGSYNAEKVGTDIVGDYTIDTCDTIDQGWETAIWKGENPIIIVQRYGSKGEAEAGHKYWVDICKLKPAQAWSVQTDRYENFEEEE
jgi:hypothetical protein